MGDVPSAGAACVSFRYPDGSREYAYLDTLPIGGEWISRNGVAYVVAAIGTDGAGNAMVTLESALNESGGELAELAQQ